MINMSDQTPYDCRANHKAAFDDISPVLLEDHLRKTGSKLAKQVKERGVEEISELLGKETIDLYNQSENRGAQVSHGLSYQKLGKELMTQDELAVMDGGRCIFMLRGVRPFLSEKYDLTKHPNYKYTADADPKNVFDMERYMKKRQRMAIKPADSFDVYEIDVTE